MVKITPFAKWVVTLNFAVPAALLAWDAMRGQLGANPVNFAIRTTGAVALIFLVLTLAITPAMRLAGWNWLGQFRRLAGLYAFFHAAIHFSLFFLFDRAANLGDTLSEVVLRPYLLVGMVGLVIMVPLAATSTNSMIRRLGSRRWKALHRLTYVAAIAGATHYYLLVKADTTWPIAFASAFAGLLGYRLVDYHLGLRRDALRFRSGVATSHAVTSRPKIWSGPLRVAKIFVETPQVRTFRLVPVDGGKLPFQHQPGQYLNLALEVDGQKVRRSYTIASAPSQAHYCEMTIKREPHGLASRHLHDALREGDILQVSAPAGRFVFGGTEAQQITMIAGGVGITPLMAKIRYLTDVGWPGSIHLIFSVKRSEDVIFRQELAALEQRFSNLGVTVTLTSESDRSWQGERGRVSRELIERVAPEIAKGRVHLCGPTEMTNPIIETLQAMGVPKDNIHFESFASPSRQRSSAAAGDPVSATAPVATSPAIFEVAEHATLEFARSGKTINDLKGRTVLELAEDAGIEIPYDCRAGVCGQCKTRLLAGNVAMDARDALSSAELASGIILSCQARCLDQVLLDA